LLQFNVDLTDWRPRKKLNLYSENTCNVISLDLVSSGADAAASLQRYIHFPSMNFTLKCAKPSEVLFNLLTPEFGI
jgi:hypothetical protein